MHMEMDMVWTWYEDRYKVRTNVQQDTTPGGDRVLRYPCAMRGGHTSTARLYCSALQFHPACVHRYSGRLAPERGTLWGGVAHPVGLALPAGVTLASFARLLHGLLRAGRWARGCAISSQQGKEPRRPPSLACAGSRVFAAVLRRAWPQGVRRVAISGRVPHPRRGRGRGRAAGAAGTIGTRSMRRRGNEGSP